MRFEKVMRSFQRSGQVADGTELCSNRLLKKSPRLRDQIIGRGFFHSWLGCAADS